MYPKKSRKEENIKKCCNVAIWLMIFLQIFVSSIFHTSLTTCETQLKSSQCAQLMHCRLWVNLGSQTKGTCKSGRSCAAHLFIPRHLNSEVHFCLKFNPDQKGISLEAYLVDVEVECVKQNVLIVLVMRLKDINEQLL